MVKEITEKLTKEEFEFIEAIRNTDYSITCISTMVLAYAEKQVKIVDEDSVHMTKLLTLIDILNEFEYNNRYIK